MTINCDSEDDPSPIRMLPTELVSEIFLHFIPIYPNAPPVFGTESPTLLTQICHKWREIALATPALWRAIFLRSKDDAPPLEQQVQIFNVWLERSRTSPLSIRVGGAGRAILSPFLASIVPHRPRWEYLKLEWEDIAFSESWDYLGLLNGPMLRFRHLDMTLYRDDTDGSADEIIFRDAPLLRTAILNYAAAELPLASYADLGNAHRGVRAQFLVHCEIGLVLCEIEWHPKYFPTLPVFDFSRLESLAFKPKTPRYGRNSIHSPPLLSAGSKSRNYSWGRTRSSRCRPSSRSLGVHWTKSSLLGVLQSLGIHTARPSLQSL
ncbi:hypothetical protein C8F04DRAFT_1090692 [Mycena alexandri]|uniref:F-box domain-containing protein n=1 Tax=Mycena alexandri TaxID=1745969 RepID=A0AAD6T182_9AGAR|nr:hypothetical protein C8F04DRAFT_1090692 [Mycena alexandri]